MGPRGQSLRASASPREATLLQIAPGKATQPISPFVTLNLVDRWPASLPRSISPPAWFALEGTMDAEPSSA